jgi:hypothetical protein
MVGIYSLAGKNKNRTVSFALGLTICYQVIYQFIMLVRLQDRERTTAEADIAEARAAAARLPFAMCDHAGIGAAENSTVCAEVATFRRWRQGERDLSVGYLEHVSDKSANLSGLDYAVTLDSSLGSFVDTATRSTTTSVPATVSGRPESPGVTLWTKVQSWQAFDKLYNETLAAIRTPHSLSPWAKQLIELPAKFTSKRTKFDPPPASIIQSESSLTPWAQDLMALQARLEKGMELSRSRRLRHNMTRVPQTLVAAIHDFGEILCKEPHRWNYSACAMFLVPRSNVPDFSTKPKQTSQLRGGMAEHTAAFGVAKSSHKAWQQDFAKEVADYGRELCSDPRRLNYTSCAQFMLHGVEGGTSISGSSAPSDALAAQAIVEEGRPRSANLRGTTPYMDRLHWTGIVKQLHEGKGTRGHPRIAQVSREQIQDAKWQGRIPKVACITVVPARSDTPIRLKYFLKNFQLQRYEGPRQLVLVYQSSDIKLGELLRSYADGTYIKTAGLNDYVEFPSTAALRYGAWLADADIIAHWSFYEWHHPQRLAWQVRALASAVRPVSLVKNVSGTISTAASDVVFSETSLVAEASWAQQHWMPYMGTAYHPRDIVQVNIPELAVHTLERVRSNMAQADTEAKNNLSVDVERNTQTNSKLDVTEGVQATNARNTGLEASQGGTAVCASLALAKRVSLVANSSVTGAIQKVAGIGFADTFREMIRKREEIENSLHSLCHDVQLERDGDRQNELLKAVSEIESVHRRIIASFDTVEGLFQNASSTLETL